MGSNGDLISRSALIAEHCDGCDALVHGLCDHDVCGAAQLIMEAPAVDAVEIVRCRDCVYYKQNPYNSEDIDLMCQCWADWLPTDDNDFCSYGERRGENGRDK